MPPDRSGPKSRTSRKTTQPSPPCQVCGKTVSRSSDMKRHQLTHQERMFPCPKPGCTYSARTAAGLKVHTDGHDGNVKKCPTDNCPYASHDPATLLRHRISKHGHKPRKVAPKGGKLKDYIPPCVPATVRRTVTAQEHGPPPGIYGQFQSFPVDPTMSTSSTATNPTVTDTLSDLSPLTIPSSDSDSDLSSRSTSPAPSDSSSSSDISLPDIATIRRANALWDARLARPY